MDFLALRVLDLGSCKWLENKHVKGIGSSRQLRYLRIGSDKITELPEEIGKLQHLETLDLRDCYRLDLRLPSTVVRLQKLVRLFVISKTWLPAVEFGSMQALEVLEELNIWNTDNPMRFAEELGRLTKLRKLHLEGRGEAFKVYARRERLRGILASSISDLGKCNLRHLEIDLGEMSELIFRDPCCTYPYLQDLKINQRVKIVPKGMASLKNLVKLWISVRKFDVEGLHLLMGLPSLARLQLQILRPIKKKLTVGSNGFRLLKVFHFKYWHFEVDRADGQIVTFAPSSVPALRRLHLGLNPMAVASDFLAELGVEHLSGLAHLMVEIDCYRAAPSRVEALVSSIEKAVDFHPNREMEIHVSRTFVEDMYKDDKK